jgi:hypothetical protein
MNSHCKRGHEFTDDNIQIKKKKDGTSQRTCRKCANASSLANYHRRSKRAKRCASLDLAHSVFTKLTDDYNLENVVLAKITLSKWSELY